MGNCTAVLLPATSFPSFHQLGKQSIKWSQIWNDNTIILWTCMILLFSMNSLYQFFAFVVHVDQVWRDGWKFIPDNWYSSHRTGSNRRSVHGIPLILFAFPYKWVVTDQFRQIVSFCFFLQTDDRWEPCLVGTLWDKRWLPYRISLQKKKLSSLEISKRYLNQWIWL